MDNSNLKKRKLWILGISALSLFFLFALFHGSGSGGESTTDGSQLQLHPQAYPYKVLEYRNETIRLQDVLTGRLHARGFNGTWLDEHTIQYFSASGSLNLYDIALDKKTVLLSAQDISQIIPSPPYSAVLSPSRKFLLVSFAPERVFRHSATAFYAVIELKTKDRKLSYITSNPSSNDDRFRRLQLAKWSEKGDNVVFVYQNDVYFVNVDNPVVTRVTNDGNEFIYNGVADWVYEEELLNTNEAVWMTDNNTIIFVSFNDTMVGLAKFTVYDHLQYAQIEEIPYPKSGTANPTATVRIYSHKDGKAIKVKLPNYVPQEHYIASIKPIGGDQVLLQVLNRVQNSSFILLCSKSTTCQNLHSEDSSTWIDTKQLFKIGEGRFITLETVKTNDRHFSQLIEFNTNSVMRVLTHEPSSIQKILAVKDSKIFYTTKGHLYVYVEEAGVKCLTCSLACEEVDIQMEHGAYFTAACHNFLEKVPTIGIYKAEVPAQLVKMWQDNARLSKLLRHLQLPTRREFTFKRGGYDVKVQLQLPFDFDETKKYPMLIDVYGGPGTNRINAKYTIDWGDSLVSSRNVIYAHIDGRGSGGQSEDFTWEIYRRFGTVEVEDQIEGARQIVKRFPFVDPNKVAIWGWSYGGFVTAMAMGKDTGGVIKCGISVAPVTNWMFYDTIYTERYMSVPSDNVQGYNASDVINYVPNFRKKKFLLIHGNADDNVHYQQSMYLSRALELEDIDFEQQSYPDENHSLSSVRAHLYHKLEKFLFTQCFK